ncbi:MAG: hypothetical protein HIU89_12090 [Proteobacteria bacterium]|nr:hypothetical protein [Pseudomonadota bacterium]
MVWIACTLVGALVTLGLASCGGGGVPLASSGGGVGTGGTGISFGTVTGFGSIVVDGTPYSSATPNYFAGNDQDESAPTAAPTVELGDQLTVQLDAQGNPTTVVIDPELIGAVANLAASSFMVNGVRVRINTDPKVATVTYYAGLSGFSGLSNGMQVEVHGAFGIDASGQGYVQATLIRQLPSANPVTRVTGIVSSFNSAAGTFQIGGTTIQMSASMAVSPGSMSIANGELVNVWSNTSTMLSGVINAGVIHIRTLQGVSGAVQIGGLIAQLQGTSLTVSGIAVDASNPGLASTVPSLSQGEYVVVQGMADATTGIVKATSIRAYAAQPAKVELTGTITGFVSASNFLVRGVPVDASQAQFSSGASVASLANGVYVAIVGDGINSNVVTALTVTVLPNPPEGGTVNYQGIVGNLAVTGNVTSFALTHQDDGVTTTSSVVLAPNVAFANGTVAQLVNGATIELEATNSAGGLTAYSVSFQNGSSNDSGSSGSSTLETKGIVYAYNNGASFVVNGLTIQTNNVQPSGGSLADGVQVDVKFVQTGNSNLAQAISIDH